MTSFTHLDDADRAAFERDGYLFKRGMFTPDEVALCNRVIATDPAIQGSRLKVADTAGGSTELALWNHPGRRRLRHDRALRARRRRGRGAARRRGLSLPQQAHHEAAGRRRALGVAPGLRLLVPERLPVAGHALGRGGAGARDAGKRLHAGAARAATSSAGSSMAASPARPAPTPSASSRRSSSWSWSTARWRPATRCSSMPTRCTARPPTSPTAAAISCSAATTRPATTPTRPHHHPGYTKLAKVPDEAVLAAGDRVADAQGRWFLEEGKDETTEAHKAG